MNMENIAFFFLSFKAFNASAENMIRIKQD